MYKANQNQKNNRDKNTNIKQTDYRETMQMYKGYYLYNIIADMNITMR